MLTVNAVTAHLECTQERVSKAAKKQFKAGATGAYDALIEEIQKTTEKVSWSLKVPQSGVLAEISLS